MYMLHGHEIYDGKNAEDMEIVRALYKIGTPLRYLDQHYARLLLYGGKLRFRWYLLEESYVLEKLPQEYMYRVGIRNEITQGKLGEEHD